MVGSLAFVDVYLMRHGEAADAARDADRPLTVRGQAQARASATGLLRLGVEVPLVRCSPYRRAVETAAIVAEVCGARVVEDDRFVPGGSAVRAAEAVMAERGGGFVVAHMPILPGIVDVIAGGRVTFATASVAHLVVVGGSGMLAGLFSSEFLERIR